jgi:transaldolase/glucose-6-phosphate isomerase
MSLPAELKAKVGETLRRAAAEGWGRRMWARDPSLWSGGDADKWLGWLEAGAGAAVDLGALDTLRDQVKAAGYAHAVLLGMGGSSLGPEVLAATFPPAAGHPRLLVLDSTDPDQIARIEAAIDPARTLFIVSSKSGSTLEPDILHRYFYARVEAALGQGRAGAHFIAVTDPGSDLEKAAKADGFAAVFPGRPDIGGRYSVLSNFGMVPAAVIGLDVRALYDTVALMVRACAASAPPAANAGVRLGVMLGTAAKAGRDKVTLIASPGIIEIGAWLEQLLAESTGKHGLGLIPVDGEPLGQAKNYAVDRVFVFLRLQGDDEPEADGLARELEEAGHPVVRITLADTGKLAQEFFRWEVAVAIAGAVIGIDPFDQPDVEASKVKARELTQEVESNGHAAAAKPVFAEDGLAVFVEPGDLQSLESRIAEPSLEAFIGAHFARAADGDYLGLLAWLDRNSAHTDALQAMRRELRDRLGHATVLGFGPRFLHSTGQAYKGGPNSGLFLEITARPRRDLPVPGRKVSFGEVEAAQAQGDLTVLAERGRRTLRIDLGEDIEGGLRRLGAAVDAALA